MEYRGTPVSRGIAIAPVFCFHDSPLEIPKRTIDVFGRDKEKVRYLDALQTAKSELEAVYRHWLPIDANKAAIFQAHIDLLFDEQIMQEIEAAVQGRRQMRRMGG